MNQILFQFAILLHPPKQNSVLVVLPTTILASNHQTVLIRAAKLIPNEYDDRLDQIEVLIRTYQPQLNNSASGSTLTISNGTTDWAPFDYSGTNLSSRGNILTSSAGVKCISVDSENVQSYSATSLIKQ